MNVHSIPTLTALEAAQAALVVADSRAEGLMVSERQYRRLFEAARDGILLLNSETGRVTDANPFMTELLGYSHDELLGKELWEIGLLRDKEASQQAFLRLKRDKHIRYEDLPLENRGGAQRDVEFVSNLYREAGHTVIQCNIRDITERKRVEAELVAASAKHAHQDAVLEEWTCLARESLTEARLSVAAPRSPALQAAPLSEALARLLAQRVLNTSVKSRYTLVGVPRALPVLLEHYLLRIGQETIVNAVAHAQAQEIAVELPFEDECVRLSVQDDGVGFDSQLSAQGRFGIVGMRERTEKAQGLLTIVSHPGQGTRVDLTVPLPISAPTDSGAE